MLKNIILNIIFGIGNLLIRKIKNPCFHRDFLLGLSAGKGISDSQNKFNIFPYYSDLFITYHIIV